MHFSSIRLLLSFALCSTCFSLAAAAPAIDFDVKQVGLEGELGSFEPSWSATQSSPHLQHITLVLESPEPAVLPKLTLKWRVPAIDIAGHWVSDNLARKHDHYRARVRSRAVQHAPLLTYLNQGDRNRFTVALSDAMNPSLIRGVIREEDAFIYMDVTLFEKKTPATDRYELTLRFDTRPVMYETAIGDTAHWWASMDEHTPAPVPEMARVPVYSTWYSYHQKITADAIVEECRIGGELGLEGVIVDDGWQTLDGNRGYAYTGDWKPERIPEMKAFVDRVHALDQEFLLWYSVPMAGEKSEMIKDFRDKTLYFHEGFGAYVLDPRYPEVREYLIGVYEAAVRDWGIDGLKLDFIGMFSEKGAGDLTAEDGRDYASVDKAVDRLMTDVMARLRALNPEIGIEFRQPYNGPLMRKYGNMFRAVDCANVAPYNRRHIVDLRLIADTTSVHSDMIMWHPDEPVESAALQVLNILFSVPQISVRLADISPDHRKMLKFWLGYWTENKSILLDGDFRAVAPAQNYPMVMGRQDGKLIATIYQDMFVPSGSDPLSDIDIVNGKSTPGAVLRLEQDFGMSEVTIYDTLGKVLSRESLDLEAGAHAFDVSPSGLVEIRKL
ncbi:glycoside hydrolase family 36 protein [Coraliomargarita sinensis]|nr:glycoside hydrolase family 36 protein [Coraliomargarita sinensis]